MRQNLDFLNYHAYQYALSRQEQFKEISKPLSLIGIKYFGYMKLFETGEYLLLHTAEDLHKQFLKTITTLDHNFIKAYQTIHDTNYFLVPYNYNSSTVTLLTEHKVWNLFILLKVTKTGEVSSYGFSTDINDPLFSQCYFQNLSLLQNFCTYFEEQARHLIDWKDKKKLSRFQQTFDFSNNSPNIIPNKNIEELFNETCIRKNSLQINNQEFKFSSYNKESNNKNTNLPLEQIQEETHILKTNQALFNLSKREGECLSYLSLGKTIKEIGKILDLSPRSIEFYLSNLKKKTGHNRSELIKYFAAN